MIKFGDNNIGKIYLGSNLIGKAFIGNNVVYVSGGGSSTTYAVVLSLTHCTSSNSATRVEVGASYTTTISAESGYNISSVIVTMGGIDITSQCYNASTGVISIASVIGSLSIICVAESLFSLDWAFNRIRIQGVAGSHAHFSFRDSTRSLSPLIECSAGDSITFSANTTTSDNGHLCFFNSNYEYIAYYGSNANPRTITIGSTSSAKYCALCMLTSNLANSYITNNTTGGSWNGSTYPSSKILDAEDFPAKSPIASNIDFAIGEHTIFGWNGSNTTTISTSSIRSDYKPTLWMEIGTNRADYVANTFFSPYIDVTNLQTNESGRHVLRFYAGGNTTAVLKLIDDSAEYANYYSMQSSERTADFSTRYNKVQIYGVGTLIGSSYVKDDFTGDTLWDGANEL